MNRRSALAVSLVGCSALACGYWAKSRLFPAPPIASAATLFDARFLDLSDRAQSVSRWRDQILVVNFWATWCAPCVDEMPDLERIHREFQTRGVSVIGLGIDRTAALKDFRDRHHLTFPILAAETGGLQLAARIGNEQGALPYTVLVGKEQTILWSKLGRFDPQALRAQLTALTSS